MVAEGVLSFTVEVEAAGLGVTGVGAETVIKNAPDLVIRGFLGGQGEPWSSWI